MTSISFDFMTYPNWVVSERGVHTSLRIVRDDLLYELTTMADRLPSRVDKLVLVTLLGKSQSDPFVETTTYAVAKAISGNRVNDQAYRMVARAMNRWLHIRIKVTDENSEKRTFRVIETISQDDGKLKISFNPSFITEYRKSGCDEIQNFCELTELKSPASMRLYEILNMQFLDKTNWVITLQELKELMTMKGEYPSQILRIINRSIEELNRSTEMKIHMNSSRDLESSFVLSFRTSCKSIKTPVEFQPLRKQTSVSTAFNS